MLELFNVNPLSDNNFSKLCVSPGAILSKSFPYVASGLFTVSLYLFFIDTVLF